MIDKHAKNILQFEGQNKNPAVIIQGDNNTLRALKKEKKS